MLSRPAIHRDTTTPIERAQIAAVFGLIGAALGMLIVALAFWLYQLHNRIQEQTESFTVLSRLVQKSADSQRWVDDTLKEKLGTEKAADFTAQYASAAEARDHAKVRLETHRLLSEDLARENKQLKGRVESQESELQATRKERETHEKEHEELTKLTKRVASLDETNQEQKARLLELEVLSETPDGKKTLAMQEQLVRTRYVAIGGLSCSAVLCAGLVGLYFYFKPLADDATEIGDRPSHRIE